MQEELSNNVEKSSLNSNEILEQLLKPEVQDSLNVLIENLPKLAEMSSLLTSVYEFSSIIAKDETLKNDTVSAVTELATPVVNKVKSVAQTSIEARDVADKSTETIGVFGLLKILKDPQVQSVLRFVNAFLEVSAEKKVIK